MSGVANSASDVIIVMGHEPDASGAKDGQDDDAVGDVAANGDVGWQEEGGTSEGVPGQNRARKQAAPKSAGGMVEAVQSLK
ncbi:hypothetical protein FOYG_16903 [Fusarium oxysporum NRRL 32931]|uniref:Uncharacterized protein n=1 Tax=Fusarium oxysporum NRRL 32931 TaxID=660029 RepID=W9HCM1_FUSOX|nr:hypothetical protein FOYG_16903 [Fusarium oxysporum NRRL 32931]EWZ78400.1 hypothetical protein FOWG_17364 [Fusarium oxysporum f. sp. lycopersici MN25]